MNNIQCPALPRDLWVMTLRNREFSAVDLVHLKRVCRLFRDIIQDPWFQSMWQMQFEFDFDPTRFKYWVNVDWQQKFNEYAIADKERTEEFNYYKSLGTDAEYDPKRVHRWLKPIIEQKQGTDGEIEAALSLLEKNINNLDGEMLFHFACLLMNGIGTPQDQTRGFDLIKRSAESGFTKAQLALTECYGDGIRVPVNAEKSFKWANLAADQGCAGAHLRLARAYQLGIGTAIDIEEAFRHLKFAVDLGNEWALYSAWIFRKKGFQVNDEIALDYLTRAANRGLAKAQYELGKYYLNVSEPLQDFKKSFFYLGLAADQGLDKAQFLLAKCYYYGAGTEISLKESCLCIQKAIEKHNSDAEYVFKGFAMKDGKLIDIDCDFRFKMISANKGTPEAQFTIGCCFWNGECVDKDPQEGLRYFIMAADKGHVKAQLMLGFFMPDKEESLRYLKMAADQGNADAQNELGDRYIKVEGNYTEALRYFTMAANKDDGLGLLNLAKCHYSGWGTEKNDEKAFYYFTKAAEKKIPEALHNLAVCYLKGTGTSVDAIKALRFLNMSAELRHPDSQYALGKYYLKNLTYLNEPAGFHYLRLAANNGHVKAMYALAMCYLQGKGTEQDEKKAKQEMLQAAEHGHPKAIKWLQALEKNAFRLKLRKLSFH